MDALLRLRVLIWVVVISLWGVMVYQYLGEEEKENTAMRRVVNPYRPEGAPAPGPDDGLLASAPAAVPAPPAVPPAAAPPADIPAANIPPATAPAPNADPTLNVVAPSEAVGVAPPAGTPGRTPVPAGNLPARPTRPAHPSKPTRWREDRAASLPDPPIPPGFQKTVTRHFNVYAETYEASDRFLELLENLHANLMLDLAPFSPWASEQRVSVFLFKNQDTYRKVTGRPPWSGGASSVPKRKVYVYESEELPGILAHELTHIYFDGFFLDGTTDPLWLSEGMATLVQVERGLAAPNWLRENLSIINDGGGFGLDALMGVASTSGMTDDKVRLWYAQSFSVVRYLIRTQYKSSFFKFAAHLRDGRPAPEALYRAYGAPYTRVRALEIAWRHSITRPAAPAPPQAPARIAPARSALPPMQQPAIDNE